MMPPRRNILRPHRRNGQESAPSQRRQRLQASLEQATNALTRWQSRLKRAFNAVAKHQRQISRLHRQLQRLNP